MRNSLNIDRLEVVASGLGDRLAETAFVGGAVRGRFCRASGTQYGRCGLRLSLPARECLVEIEAQ